MRRLQWRRSGGDSGQTKTYGVVQTTCALAGAACCNCFVCTFLPCWPASQLPTTSLGRCVASPRSISAARLPSSCCRRWRRRGSCSRSWSGQKRRTRPRWRSGGGSSRAAAERGGLHTATQNAAAAISCLLSMHPAGMWHQGICDRRAVQYEEDKQGRERQAGQAGEGAAGGEQPHRSKQEGNRGAGRVERVSKCGNPTNGARVMDGVEGLPKVLCGRQRTGGGGGMAGYCRACFSPVLGVALAAQVGSEHCC